MRYYYMIYCVILFLSRQTVQRVILLLNLMLLEDFLSLSYKFNITILAI